MLIKSDKFSKNFSNDLVSDDTPITREKMTFTEGIPERYNGNYYNYEKLHIFQNFKDNYFFLDAKVNFDYEMIVNNWLRYNISYFFRNDHFHIHGAFLKYKGNNLIFAGDSGSGKTTASYILMKKGAKLFTDEYTLINEKGISFIPRTLCVDHRSNNAQKSFKSEVLNNKIFTVANRRKIEIFNEDYRIIFLTKKREAPLKLYLGSLHRFDYYTNEYYKKAFEFYAQIINRTEVFVCKDIKDLRSFIESL